MNWEAFGAVGELLGAAGVIVTLIYLARQIRLSTKATRLATSRSIASAAREWNRPLLEDPELAWTFQVGTEDPSALAPRFQMYWEQRRETFRPDFRAFIDDHAPPEASTWGRLATAAPQAP